MSETRYPLAWPTYVPRTKQRIRSAFNTKYTRPGASYKSTRYKTMEEASSELQTQLDLLRGASGIILSTNLVVRLDGMPRSGQAQPSDPGAALYFTRDKHRICMPCDKWDRVEDNVYAIAKHIEAMRGMERWGVGTTEQAFAGYQALPAKASSPWREVLGISTHITFPTEELVQSQFRLLSKVCHPDMPDGDEEKFRELVQAREAALMEIRA